MSATKPVNQYDATYFIGNATIYVVAPRISWEERQKRLDHIQRINWILWDAMQSNYQLHLQTNT
ncbi:hypothetical protein C8P63_12418 [Melghirimyces profundicolus]|uniref:Uncharacterized protein n=1 Tax=Melghirimyces profundicolus TaxID=1242148 RepID=A0A2T6BD62_9BACL|nr:hypothetical protein C8P63_12418 [Melghirimyces profundicolus]